MANLLNIDPKKFKHIHSDEHHTTLQHPAGHIIKIAHNVLHPEAKAQLKALSNVMKENQTSSQAQEAQDQNPKMANGGVMPGTEPRPGKSIRGMHLERRQETNNTEHKETHLKNAKMYAKENLNELRNTKKPNIEGLAKGGKIEKEDYHQNEHPNIPLQPNDIPGPTTLSYADGGVADPDPQPSPSPSASASPSVGETIREYLNPFGMGKTTGPMDQIREKHEEYYKRGEVPPPIYYAEGGQASKMYARGSNEPIGDEDSAPEKPAEQPAEEHHEGIDITQGKENLAKVGHAVLYGLRALAGTDQPGPGPIDPETRKFKDQENQTPAQEPGAPDQSNTQPPPTNQQVQQAQFPKDQEIDQEVSDNENAAQKLATPMPMPQPVVRQQPTQNLTQEQQFQQHKQQAAQDMDKETQAWQNDLQNGHIAPKTYQDLFADKSTLGKIGTIFGMMLGGFSGLAHQQNPMMQLMDKQITNDLEAQKQSKTNAYNYLNLAREHELSKAQAQNLAANTAQTQYALSKIRMNQAALHDLVTNMKKITDPAKRAQAEQTLAMLNSAVQSDNFNLKDRAATAEAYQKMVLGTQTPATQGQPGAQNIPDPAKEIRKRQLVGAMNPEQANKALDEVKHIQNHQQVNQNALDSFDKVAKLTTLASKMTNPIQNSKRVDAEWYPMLDKLTKDTEGRVTPITVDLMSTLKPTISDNKDTLRIKREKLNAILHAGFSTPTLDSFNIPIDKGDMSQPSDTVVVISPTGQSGTIPRENLQRALQMGYRTLQ
jgi:hypothetical protein